MSRLPHQYQSIRKRFRGVFANVEKLGSAARKAGPLDEKTGHLIQLAAAAAIRSEGSVHSHARRALEAGVTPDELYHTALLLISTIGFPTVSATLSWIDDVLAAEGSITGD